MTQQPKSPVLTEPQDDEFPDPKRSWKRTGSLLGGWVGTWAAVAILGTLWNVLLAPVMKSDPSEHQVDGRTTVKLFFEKVYEDEDPENAETYVCDSDIEPSPNSMVDELEDLAPDADIDIEGSSTDFTVEIRLFGGPFAKRLYSVTTTENGGSSCINRISQQSQN